MSDWFWLLIAVRLLLLALLVAHIVRVVVTMVAMLGVGMASRSLEETRMSRLSIDWFDMFLIGALVSGFAAAMGWLNE